METGTNLAVPIEVYKPFVEQLAELQKLNAEKVFDYESPDGNKEARSHVYSLRRTKGAVDAARKQAKEESLQLGRRIDAEAKVLISAIEEMIEQHDTKIKAIEQREIDRVAGIRDRIDGMLTIAANKMTRSSDLRAQLTALKVIAIDDSFAEFATEAAKVKDAVASEFERAIEAAEKAEAEAAELARLRAEDQARKVKERDAAIAAEAEARAKAEADKKAKAVAEEAAARERKIKDDAAKRELKLKADKDRAEREAAEAKLAAERAASAERKRIEDKAAKVAAEEARRQADEDHRRAVHNIIIKSLAIFMDATAAQNLITLIDVGDIPHVKIVY